MPKLLLIDVALYAALIMAAAAIVVSHRRRSRGQRVVPVRRRREAAAEPARENSAGENTVQREKAAAPAPHSDGRAPRSGADQPAAREKPAESRPRRVTSPGPGPRRPRAAPARQQGGAGTATSAERIASYYEQADRPMSDYLKARGWAKEPRARHPGAADANPAPESAEATTQAPDGKAAKSERRTRA